MALEPPPPSSLRTVRRTCRASFLPSRVASPRPPGSGRSYPGADSATRPALPPPATDAPEQVTAEPHAALASAVRRGQRGRLGRTGARDGGAGARPPPWVAGRRGAGGRPARAAGGQKGAG